MRKFLFILFFISWTYLFGQNENVTSSYAIGRLSDGGGLSPNETVYGIPKVVSSELVGDIYYFNEYKKVNVVLNNGKFVKNLLANYNIDNQQLEISFKQGVRILEGSLIKSFEVINADSTISNFVTAQRIKFKDTELRGFFEVLHGGTFSLFKQYELSFVKSQHVPALNAGSNDIEVRKKAAYYIHSNNEVIELPKTKKEIRNYFLRNSIEVDNLIEFNSLKLRMNQDLRLFLRRLIV